MFILPRIKLNIERWKYNPTFEVYVSTMGHIKNKSKADIAPKINQSGYVMIYVTGSSPRWISAHRLVMLTWKPTAEAEMLTVDHLDHNKRNNSLSNLEWVTAKENQKRADLDYIPALENKVKSKEKTNDKGFDKVMIDNKNFLTEPIILCCTDVKVINEFCEKYSGKISNFNKKGAKEIIKNIYYGKNSQGYKKWCGFEFIGIKG